MLPDLEHWDDHFAHVRFDGDPTEDVPSIASLSEDEKHRVAGMYNPSLTAFQGESHRVSPYKPDLQAMLALSAVPHNALMVIPNANPAFPLKRRLECEASVDFASILAGLCKAGIV